MGWKTLKEHYKIKHTVQVTREGICIGSPYIHNLIVVSLEGSVVKPYKDGRVNEDLQRYQQNFDADPAALAEIVKVPDTFAASIPVYTYDSETSEIIEKRCEVLGWPNCTHDGEMMFENTFSADRGQVIEWARTNAEIALKWAKERKEELLKNLATCEARIEVYEAGLERLKNEI